MPRPSSTRLSLVILAIGASAGHAQLLGQPTCGTCRITIENLTPMRPSGEDEGSFPDWPSSMAADSRGRLYFAFQSPDQVPMVFAPSGRFVQRLGRVGDGPGEYRNPRRVTVMAGDTITILDPTSRKVTYLTPGYRYVRSSRVVGKANAVASLRNGDLLVNADLSTGAAIGLPLHRVSPEGTLLRSFGDENASARPNDIYLTLRHLMLRGSTAWTITQFYEYRVEGWDSTGTRRTVLRRKADWFAPYAKVSNPTPTSAPTPAVRDAWLDSEGRLWVLTMIADPKWSAGLGEGTTSEGGRLWKVIDPDRVFDTVLDVIDLQKGTLLATERLDQFYALGGGPDRIARVVQDASGSLHIFVGTVRLQLSH